MRVQQLNVNAVLVGDRYRDSLGDLTELARSLAHEGQQRPIVVLDTHELLFGERRLEAARRLGWQNIDALQVTTVAEAAEAIRNDPHTGQPGQLAMKLSERVSMAEPLYGLRHREIERGGFKRVCDANRRSSNEVDSLVMNALGVGRKPYHAMRFALTIADGRRLRKNSRPVTDPERALARKAVREMDAGAAVEPILRTLRAQLGYLPNKHSPSLPFDPKRTSLTPTKRRVPLLPQIEVSAGRLFPIADQLRRRMDDDRWPELRSKLPPGVLAGLRELHEWLGEELAHIPNPEAKDPK